MRAYSPQSRREHRVNFYFSFAAEAPANETKHAFGKLYIASHARRAEVYSFSPSQRKGIERKFSAYSAPLMSTANGR
jgi:hypothetical protein